MTARLPPALIAVILCALVGGAGGVPAVRAAGVDLMLPGLREAPTRLPVGHLLPIDNQETLGMFGDRTETWEKAKRSLGALFLLRYEVWPSNEGHWLVNLRMLDEQTAQLELVSSVLTNRGRVEVPSPLVKAKYDLDAETAELLYRAWLAGLRETRFPPSGVQPEGWRSGPCQRFAAFMKGYGWLEGQTFSPTAQPAAGLVALGEKLRQLLEAEAAEQPALLAAIQRDARALGGETGEAARHARTAEVAR